MQDSQSVLRFAGDVKLDKVVLRSLNGNLANIAAQIEAIDVYEDLFSPFMTLSIVMRESVDYLNLFPFIGEEYIDLAIRTPTLKRGIEGSFYIYKITDRMYTKEREVMYTIKAISEEWLLDANRKLSQTFKGNCAEIATKLFTATGLNTKKQVFIEKASNKTAFTATYWAPSHCLNFLATNAINTEKSATYLFYENRYGFNFRSIDQLLKAPTYSTFIKDNYSRSLDSDNGASATRNIQEDFKRIIEFDVPVLTDYMEDIQSGRLKSRIISHDLVTKQYNIRDFNLKTDSGTPATLLNKNQAFSKHAMANSASSIIVMGRHHSNYTNFADVTNYDTIQKRMSFFQNLQKYKVNVQIIGRTDYTVGQVVELNIPKATQITKEQNETSIDEILSGRYLVSAISHRITKESHMCDMELIKNSIIMSITK